MYASAGSVLKCQNNVACHIRRAPRHQNGTILLQQLHWLPICEWIKYKIACMCCNAITGSAPSYLSELLHLYSPCRSLRSSGNMRDAWNGLKTIAGHSKPKFKSSNKPGDKQKKLSDELNDFCCWFDTQDFRKVVNDVEDFDFEIDVKIVEGIFLKLKGPIKAVFVCNGPLKIDPIMKV